jgi:hypothetical protein
MERTGAWPGVSLIYLSPRAGLLAHSVWVAWCCSDGPAYRFSSDNTSKTQTAWQRPAPRRRQGAGDNCDIANTSANCLSFIQVLNIDRQAMHFPEWRH